MVNGIHLSLTTLSPKLKNNILVCVEFAQSIADDGYVAIINLMGLDLVAEVHESMNCSHESSGRWPTDHTHNIMLDIMMDMASNLFQSGDAAFVVLKPYNRL